MLYTSKKQNRVVISTSKDISNSNSDITISNDSLTTLNMLISKASDNVSKWQNNALVKAYYEGLLDAYKTSKDILEKNILKQ